MTAPPIVRLQWAAAVAADPAMGAVARGLAPGLAWMTNAATGDCRPSMATLGRLAGVQERAARNGIGELIAAGWLLCSRSTGRSCNLYQLNLDKSASFAPFGTADNMPATRHGDAGLDESTQHGGAGLTRHDGAGLYPSTRHSGAPNPARPGIQPGTAVPPNRVEQGNEQGGERTQPSVYTLQTFIRWKTSDQERTKENREELDGLLQSYGAKSVMESAQRVAHRTGSKAWPNELLPEILAAQPVATAAPVEDVCRLPRKAR